MSSPVRARSAADKKLATSEVTRWGSGMNRPRTTTTSTSCSGGSSLVEAGSLGVVWADAKLGNRAGAASTLVSHRIGRRRAGMVMTDRPLSNRKRRPPWPPENDRRDSSLPHRSNKISTLSQQPGRRSKTPTTGPPHREQPRYSWWSQRRCRSNGRSRPGVRLRQSH